MEIKPTPWPLLSLELCRTLALCDFPHPDNWRDKTCIGEPNGELYPVPTLAELIEACGNKFGVLEQFHGGGFGAYVPNDIGVSGTGESPQEAVAKLWLAIQAAENDGINVRTIGII